jgi:hypothetical protein
MIDAKMAEDGRLDGCDRARAADRDRYAADLPPGCAPCAETGFMNLGGLPAAASSAGPGQPGNSVR